MLMEVKDVKKHYKFVTYDFMYFLLFYLEVERSSTSSSTRLALSLSLSLAGIKKCDKEFFFTTFILLFIYFDHSMGITRYSV